MIFTDLPFLPEKTVTHSLMFVLGPMVFISILFFANFKVKLNFITKIFIIFLFASLLSSILLLLFVFYKTGDIKAYGKNMLVKMFEAFYSLFLLHFLVYYSLSFLIEKLSLKSVKFWVSATFIFLTVVAFIEYIDPELLNSFHDLPKDYSRLRLFTSLNSTLVHCNSVTARVPIYISRDIDTFRISIRESLWKVIQK